ncbi:MFS general substrate transporter [Sanghuangporus baumii]|uniref:MFS general substrate transporter n=1 Tax=Sanghuangporus baumii TaxID=108892 RepID=A0A9Q5N7W2_SANBA|nr:MFS general substrate transporter [Sanghuangporus baumii]
MVLSFDFTSIVNFTVMHNFKQLLHCVYGRRAKFEWKKPERLVLPNPLPSTFSIPVLLWWDIKDALGIHRLEVSPEFLQRNGLTYGSQSSGPRKYMYETDEAFSMAFDDNTCWGILTVIQGLIHKFQFTWFVFSFRSPAYDLDRGHRILVVRILLGVFESGFMPGATYFLSCWNRRDELGLRLAIFTSVVTLAGAFGGLLAVVIANMEGIGGKPAWAWIFMLEGLITVVVGVASFFIIQDYPAKARFLSESERVFVIRRLHPDNQLSAAGERLQWRNIRKSFVDYKTWLCATCAIGSATPANSFAFFLPSIISMLARQEQIYSQFLSILWLGFVHVLSVTRLIGLDNVDIVQWAYFQLICALTHEEQKRSDLTGIASTNLYRAEFAPWYTTGHAVTLAFTVGGVVSAIALHILLRSENARRERGERDEVNDDIKRGNLNNGCYESVEAAKRDKGDEWSGFRYII